MVSNLLNIKLINVIDSRRERFSLYISHQFHQSMRSTLTTSFNYAITNKISYSQNMWLLTPMSSCNTSDNIYQQ